MKALVGAFNQEKALVEAFSVIVQPVVEPMDRFAALLETLHTADCLVSPGTLHEAPLQQQQREAEDGDYEGEAAPGVLPARGQEGEQHDTWVSGSVPSLGPWCHPT